MRKTSLLRGLGHPSVCHGSQTSSKLFLNNAEHTHKPPKTAGHVGLGIPEMANTPHENLLVDFSEVPYSGGYHRMVVPVCTTAE